MDELVRWLSVFLLRDLPGKRRLIEPNLHMLASDAGLAMLAEVARGQHDSAAREAIEDVTAVVRSCAQHGIDATFAELERMQDQFADPLASVPDGIRIALFDLTDELAATVPPRTDFIERCATVLPYIRKPALAQIWAMMQSRMADELAARGEAMGTPALLRQAIDAYNDALLVFHEEGTPGEWAGTQNRKGIALSMLGSLTGDVSLHRAALAHYDAALRVHGPANPSALQPLTNKGNALHSIARSSGDPAGYQAAIETYHDALALLGDKQAEMWAHIQLNIGSALCEQAALGGRVHMLSEAIDRYRLSLRIFAYPSREYAKVQTNLSTALQSLGAELKDTAILRKALEANDAALSVRNERDDPATWAITQASRGSILAGIARLDRDPAAARAAFDAYQATLRVRKSDEMPILWAESTLNLGNVLLFLGTLEKDLALLRLAFEASTQAIEIYREHGFPAPAIAWGNHATALLESWNLTKEEIFLTGARDAAAAGVRATDPNLSPGDYRERVRLLARIEMLLGNFAQVAALLTDAVRSAGVAVLLARSARERGEMLTQIGLIASDLAYARLRTGDVAGAIGAIAQGRGVQFALGDAIRQLDRDRRLTSLRQAFIGAQARHAMLQEQWKAATRSDASAAQDAELRILLDRSEADLGTQLDAFRRAVDAAGLQGAPIPALPEVRAALPPGGALVVVLVTGVGGAAIVVPQGGALLDGGHVAWLDALTTERLIDLLAEDETADPRHGWLIDYARFRRAMHVASDAHADPHRALEIWNAVIVRTQPQLWELVMQPIDAKLRALGIASGAEVVMMAPGRLTALPLHIAQAAGASRCFLDDWAVSCIATLQMLVAGRRQVAALAGAPLSLLAVTDPLGDLKGSEAAPPLKNPAWSLFAGSPRYGLREGEATVAAVTAQMPRATHVSFYCHASFDRNVPERTGLILASDNVSGGEPAALLTMAQLRALDLGGCRLAILGACETALTDQFAAPDEFDGLPAALIDAGIPCVLATNWLAYADTTWALTRRFLELQLDHGAALSPAQALRRASLELRDGRLGSDGAISRPQFGREQVVAVAQLPIAPSTMIANHDWPARWACFVIWGC